MERMEDRGKRRREETQGLAGEREMKRRRIGVGGMRLPMLPTDVWYTVAGLLPAHARGMLAAVSEGQRVAAEAVRDRLLSERLGMRLRNGEGAAVGRIVRKLDRAPSLKHKHLAEQMRTLMDTGAETWRGEAMHFTSRQAEAFLGVRGSLLGGGLEKWTKTRRKGRVRGPFAMFPPDCRRDEPVYGVKAVLKAARVGRVGFEEVETFVNDAVRRDEERFERARRAEEMVLKTMRDFGVECREVEYVLAASERVTEFRKGGWEEAEFEIGMELVRKLLEVHVGLGSCYRCLLICDGKARRKARHLVGKVVRDGDGFRVNGLVRLLEGNLWWARSRSNVKKMEEMRRDMPHIRV